MPVLMLHTLHATVTCMQKCSQSLTAVLILIIQVTIRLNKVMKPLHSSPSLVTKPLWNIFQVLTSWLITKIMGGFAPLQAGLANYLLSSSHFSNVVNYMYSKAMNSL